MPDDFRPRRFAVLIDADNTSPRIAAGLFEEIAKFGEASVRRIYGDFSSPRLRSWADILQKHAIDPYQQFAYTSGKNASDIALVIDAMDLLHSRRFDGFCLVSSDSDFTRLASRLREEGADVYGFGARKTPESFRQACRRFIYTENLVPEPVPQERAREGAQVRALSPASAAVPLLLKAVGQIESEDGWVGLGPVGQQISSIASDFDPRTFGFRKLSDLVRHAGPFEIAGEGRNVRIRVRPERAPQERDGRRDERPEGRPEGRQEGPPEERPEGRADGSSGDRANGRGTAAPAPRQQRAPAPRRSGVTSEPSRETPPPADADTPSDAAAAPAAKPRRRRAPRRKSAA